MSIAAAGEATAAFHGASPGGPDPADWDCILVRGVAGDWDLNRFDALYETSRYPAEWLWGPGSFSDALTWTREVNPVTDTIDTLDRYMVMHYRDGLLYLPQNPHVAAATAAVKDNGTWFVLRADTPQVAFNHQRQVLAGGYACSPTGQCPQCAVETIGKGTWKEAVSLLTARGLTLQPRDVPDARVPALMKWPRCNRILDGCWDIPDQER
jgi:hypothetical protein